jgi:selenocysteine lyase/cysteine desulfurase
VGKDQVQEWTHSQATQLKDGLAGLSGLRVVTPMAPELSSGIVCLAFDSLDPFESVLTLREAGFVVGLTPYRTGYVRVGPSLVTNPDECERLVAAVAELR